MYQSQIRYSQPFIVPNAQMTCSRLNYQRQNGTTSVVSYQVPSQQRQYVRYTSPYRQGQRQIRVQQQSPIRSSVIQTTPQTIQYTAVKRPAILSQCRSLTPTIRKEPIKRDYSPSLVDKLFQEHKKLNQIEYQLAYVPKVRTNSQRLSDNLSLSQVIPVSTSQILPSNIMVKNVSRISASPYRSSQLSLSQNLDQNMNNQTLRKQPSYKSINEQIRDGNGSKFIVKTNVNKQFLIKPLLKGNLPQQLNEQNTPKRQGITLMQNKNNLIETSKKSFEL